VNQDSLVLSLTSEHGRSKWTVRITDSVWNLSTEEVKKLLDSATGLHESLLSTSDKSVEISPV